MKNSFLILVSIICIIVGFCVGRETKSNVPQNNADGILAYQHYFECSEMILKDVTIADTMLVKEYDLARKELEDYYKGHVMTWPVICDQRDMLSDIIRKYAKEKNNNIMEYVEEYFEDPSILNGWAYCY